MATKRTQKRRRFQIPAPPKVATEAIDYTNVEVMKNYVTSAGKLLSGRICRVTAKKQRKIAQEVKRARLLALIPYTDRHQI